MGEKYCSYEIDELEVFKANKWKWEKKNQKKNLKQLNTILNNLKSFERNNNKHFY